MSKTIMEHISPSSLNDLPSRVDYLKKFVDFTAEDAAALHAAAPIVGPLVPTIVEAVYVKLFSFDITAAAFVPRQTGYTGAAPVKLEELTLDHPQVKFRKDILSAYLAKIVSMDYEKKQSWEYLDKVGLMHTGVAGFAHRKKKPALRVEFMHCALLLQYVEDILLDAIINHPDLDTQTKIAVARAVNKILWIQNDLFARHYITDPNVHSGKIRIDKVTAVSAALGLVAVGMASAKYLL